MKEVAPSIPDTTVACRRFAHVEGAPGILGATTAAKNRYRANNSPTNVRTSIPTTAANTASAFVLPDTGQNTNSTAGKTSPPSVPHTNRTEVARASAPVIKTAVRRSGVNVLAV